MKIRELVQQLAVTVKAAVFFEKNFFVCLHTLSFLPNCSLSGGQRRKGRVRFTVEREGLEKKPAIIIYKIIS